MNKLNKLVKYARNPRWRQFFFQRRFTNPSRRNQISDFLANRRPNAIITDHAAAREGADNLRTSGLHQLGKLLSAEQCAELLDYFQGCKVRDTYRPDVADFYPFSDERPKTAHVAHHDADDILDAPYLMELANDPRILDIVGEFLGCKPTIGYMSAWWSYPTEAGPQQAENFHRDVDDWRFIKLFLYLTEVGPKNGPHKYVLHSSEKPVLNKIRRLDDTEVAAAFGEENIMTMTSEPGQAFLEDTYGVHKGQPLQEGRRLLFQVVYTLNPLPYAPDAPIRALASADGIDGWTNRVYFE